MTEIPGLSGILETALYARDLEAAREFYSDVLGLPVLVEVAGRHVFFTCHEAVLLVFNPEATKVPSTNPALPVPPHGATGQGHVCFRASRTELQRWCAHLEANGIAIEADFEWPSGARSIYVRDPAGNSVEFAEPKLWGFS